MACIYCEARVAAPGPGCTDPARPRVPVAATYDFARTFSVRPANKPLM